LLSLGLQWLNWQVERIIYHHTLAVCQDILMGAFIGWSILADKKWIKKITQLPKWSVLLIYLLGIGICLAKNKLFPGQAIIFERTVISVFFGFVILDQINGQHSFFKLGKIKIFNYLGKISYGIYMYHLVVIYLLLKYIDLVSYGPIGAILILGILSVGGTFLLSSFSYRYIESKFLSLKNKWATP
jgi:peptidoglycan/LPS O-acetylase OafA/YrhL